MAINIAPKSLDTDLSELMRDVASGKAQLPEFQRSWTWDDNRIIGILASLSQGYPMGAIMRLTYGNENVKFKYRTIRSTLVIPYLNREYNTELYDNTPYPPLEDVPMKFAISRRNEWMVDQADVVVAYVTHGWGGAAATLQYAERKNKRIIRVK